VKHVAPGESPKSFALKDQVRGSFLANKGLLDGVEIENAKAAAVRALANYVVMQAALKDKGSGIHKASESFRERERASLDGRKDE